MKKHLLLVFELLLVQLGFFAVTASAQSSHAKLPVYVCMSDINDSTREALGSMGYKFTTLIDWYTPTLDETAFRGRIEKAFPDPNATGIGALDWEGSAFSRLRSGDPGSDDYRQGLNQYIRAIQIAKSMRPNVKFGFYALPFIDRQPDYQKWNAAVGPLLQECDVFFPSLYQYYPQSSKRGDKESTFVENNIMQVLKLAAQYNKMVMPFIWHRLYPDNKQHGLALVSETGFEQRVQDLVSTQYQGKGIDGIVWWASDNYYYKQNSPAMQHEAPAGADFKSYHEKLIVKYGQDIKQTLTKH
jgi:hypothetical protein